MNRRTFLSRFAAGVFASHMLAKSLFSQATVLTVEEEKTSLVYTYSSYALGFKISKEMIEDDVYGDYIQKTQVACMNRMITDDLEARI